MTQSTPAAGEDPAAAKQETSVPVPAAAGGGPISHAIFRLARLHRMHAGQLLRRIGLHPGQELVMMHLWELGPQRQTDLVRLLDSDAATFGESVAEVDRFQPILVASFCLYFALQESSPAQATIGKRLFGLVVTDLQGRRIGFLRAAVRNLSKYLSGWLLFLGFVMAAFTQRRQALHDLIAQCLVVRRRDGS